MDEEQFQRFLQVFSQSLSQITSGSSTGNCNVTPFEHFDSNVEKFCSYLERFENYASMKNVNDETKKAQLLLVSIGPTHYNNLAAYLGPEKSLKTLNYSVLTSSFTTLLTPARNVVVSQHYFFSCYQTENQSVVEYVATLRRHLADCEFHVECKCKQKISISETFLRAQFIRGIRDDWIRELLLQANLKKFDDVLAKATALEASRVQSKELGLKNTECSSHFSSSDVNKSEILQQSQHYKNRAYPRQPRKLNQTAQSRFPKRSRDFYRSLGIENLCFCCGKNSHRSNDCKVDREKLQCQACSAKGHVAKVCIKTLSKSIASNQVDYDSDFSDSTGNTSSTFHQINGLNLVPNVQSNVVDLFEFSSHPGKYMITVQIDGQPMKMEVDSGAKFSIIPEDKFQSLRLGKEVKPSIINFRAFSNDIVPCKGKIDVTVCYKQNKIFGELYIVPSGHDALLGRDWIRGLSLELKQIDKEMLHNNISTPIRDPNSITLNSVDVLSEFPSVFEEKVGCVPNCKISLTLRDGAKPTYTRERPVPYALRERVERELDDLEKAGIITPVATSDWGSPLVVIPKPDGGVRLCVDYKCGVNERLVSANYPIERIEDVLSSLRNSGYFCKLDLYKAYLHLAVDEDSSIIQTISTHRGTYKMNRLSFGIKTAPSEFNRIISQILSGLPKCAVYFDDILIHGSTLEECKQNLRMCLKRLSQYDLHLNKNKCVFFTTETEYLGHIVSKNAIRKNSKKIQAISEIPRPQNVDDVRRFLGMLTYYARFIPNYSTISFPLRRLQTKGYRFKWDNECEKAFLKLKTEMCSDRILVPFDPALPVTLTTDASPVGVAAILSHSINGVDKPIAYASRALSHAEMNYSQLDREALAVVFGVSRFYNYLYGRSFFLVTDNRPLHRIFGHNKSLPQMTSSRLLRYASFLSGFDYQVHCKKSNEIQHVDCLSRAPIPCGILQDKTMDIQINEEVNLIHCNSIFHISSTAVTAETIAKETLSDPELQKIIQNLQLEYHDSPFSISHGILFKMDRIVIPKILRESVLKELHSTHIGITKMKQLARRYVFWEGMDKHIEHIVRGCAECAGVRHNPPKVAIHPWEDPDNNWERIHIDYAGPMDGFFFLLCIDAKSKWLEVCTIRSAPTTQTTIMLLEDIFSNHGYPCQIVSDNASIFTCDAFKQYCKDRGITQRLIAPGHPATNGLAERSVQTFKRRLKAAANEPGTVQEKVKRVLFRYRATPLSCGSSPAEKYLNRKLRIRLDAIFPTVERKVKTHSRPSIRSFREGSRVQARSYRDNKNVWDFGKIIKCFGSRHYLVRLDNGRVVKRHIDQLVSTEVPVATRPTAEQSKPQSVSFNVPWKLHGAPNSESLSKSPITSSCQSPCPPEENIGMPVSPGEIVRRRPQMLLVPPAPTDPLPPATADQAPHYSRPQRARRRPTYLKDYSP